MSSLDLDDTKTETETESKSTTTTSTKTTNDQHGTKRKLDDDDDDDNDNEINSNSNKNDNNSNSNTTNITNDKRKMTPTIFKIIKKPAVPNTTSTTTTIPSNSVIPESTFITKDSPMKEQKKLKNTVTTGPATEIYTDGACRGNPGRGSWAFIHLKDGGEVSKSGYEKDTTNNRMELSAVIESLKYCLESNINNITIKTDSTYVRDGITKWIKKWIENNWKTSNKQPVKNQDLWKELYDMSNQLTVKWDWVKGHSNNKYNNAVDKLCNKVLDEN